MYEMCFFARIFRIFFFLSPSHFLYFLTILKLCDVDVYCVIRFISMCGEYVSLFQHTRKYNKIFSSIGKKICSFGNVPKKNIGNATFRCSVHYIDALTKLFAIRSHVIKFSLSLHLIHDWFEMFKAMISNKKSATFFPFFVVNVRVLRIVIRFGYI